MERHRDRGGRFVANPQHTDVRLALQRFAGYCRFEPETGCVVWTGGKTMGRGHHVPYPAFWYAGRRWFGHRWAARYIHGLDIDNLQVDHCCPGLSRPNTLCVEHLQCLTPRAHQQVTEQRRHFIHLQVGLIQYEEVYGYGPDAPELSDTIPFYAPPQWLSELQGPSHDCNACPI